MYIYTSGTTGLPKVIIQSVLLFLNLTIKC